eukprot:c15047_g2_i2 orf=706-1389(+)
MLHAKLEKLSKESSISKLEENQKIDIMEDNDGVGELEAQGVCVGIAPLDWRPAKMDTENVNAPKVDRSAMLQQSSNEDQSSFGGDSKRRNLAFHEFKRTVSEGIQQCYILNGKKLELKETKDLMQNLSVKLNDCKREIHKLNLLVTEQASGISTCEQTEAEQTKGVDEQGHIKERLEQVKAEYKMCFSELLLLKAQIQSVRKEILECQESLLDSFFKWYKKERQVNS